MANLPSDHFGVIEIGDRVEHKGSDWRCGQRGVVIAFDGDDVLVRWQCDGHDVWVKRQCVSYLPTQSQIQVRSKEQRRIHREKKRKSTE